MIAMIVLIGTEVFTRGLFNFSFQVSDELGGYMLVAISFLSLSVCQINHTFHRVELVQARLSERGRALSDLAFDIAALAFAGVLLWQIGRLELTSWSSGDEAPTYLMTKLWIPRLVMVAGTAALCLSMVTTIIADVRRIAASRARR
jgi:TRAP-type C4-dicarboxylate transport system permease small subunit